jgi:hypothetical protein
MQQIFQELQQFGLKKVDNNKNPLVINSKYILIGFNFIKSSDDNQIKFSSQMMDFLNFDNGKGKKKASKNKPQSNNVKSNQKKVDICIFTYAKFLGIYKGISKQYSHKYNGVDSPCNDSSDFDSDYDSEPDDSDSEPDLHTKGIDKKKVYYEYKNNGYVFVKNDEFNIYNSVNSKFHLFEVDNSFDDIKFLNLILMVCSNSDILRDRIIKTTCSNAEITLELIFNEFPKDYNKSFDFDIKKKYLLEDNFIFYK